MKSAFLLKYTLRFFIFKLDLNEKHRSPLFSNKNHDPQKKKRFIQKKMKKLLNYKMYTHDVTCNLSR